MTKNKYKTPSTKQEYWNIVNVYWEDLFDIFSPYIRLNSREWVDNTPINKSLEEYIKELRETQNPRIARIFNFAMWKMPEDINKSELKSWHIFYDLCTKDNLLRN